LFSPFPTCVEAPEHFLPKAQYAVETLLGGLGLAPHRAAREELREGGLYYGPAPETAPESALRFRLASETAAFFTSPRPLDPLRAGRLDWDGAAWPLLFDGGEAPEAKDVFAAAFFWLAGWDEAVTRARDRHGRFRYGDALLARLDPALPPLVDVYRAWLGARLVEHGVTVPGRSWGGKRWAVAVTVDVDLVKTRRAGLLLRQLRAGQGAAALRALTPGDARRQALHDLKAAVEARDARATWFFKAGAATPEDVAYRLEAPGLRRFLARLLADGHEVGLHPSYAACDHPRRLTAERDRLARVLDEPPRSVRTHFLRWVEPTTPRLLERAGFRLDSTLGFSERPGFRRAVATPFRLFDREAGRPLDVWELPLAVMDTTLFTHLALSPAQAEEATWQACEAARRVGGCAVLLWHNGATDAREAAERLGVLTRVLDRALAGGALLAPLEAAVASWRPGP
jgi:hypothetical protein